MRPPVGLVRGQELNMPELREDGYPCKDCEIRQWYARKFDIHFSGEDCFWECEKWEAYKKEREQQEVQK